jgi:hypothetical protein
MLMVRIKTISDVTGGHHYYEEYVDGPELMNLINRLMMEGVVNVLYAVLDFLAEDEVWVCPLHEGVVDIKFIF